MENLWFPVSIFPETNPLSNIGRFDPGCASNWVSRIYILIRREMKSRYLKLNPSDLMLTASSKLTLCEVENHGGFSSVNHRSSHGFNMILESKLPFTKQFSTHVFNLLVRFTQGMDGLLGVAGIITSDEMDHSRKFPTFSTSKAITISIGPPYIIPSLSYSLLHWTTHWTTDRLAPSQYVANLRYHVQKQTCFLDA